MDQSEFARQVEATRRRAEVLRREAERAGGDRATLASALSELGQSLEELHVAEEELRAQGEELARARDAAEEEAVRYAELFERAPDAYLVTDAEGVIGRANRAAEALLGRSRSHLAGKPLQVLLDERERAAFPRLLAALRAEEGAPPPRELALRTHHGGRVETEATVALLRDRGGRVTSLRWSLRDVTARRRSEHELALVQRLALGVGRAPDLASALRAALAILCEELGWAFAEAWLVEPGGKGLERPLCHGRGKRLRGFEAATRELEFAPGEGLVGRAWESGRPEWLADLTDPSAYLRADAAREAGLRAGLAVPVRAESGVLAVLAFYARAPSVYDERIAELSLAALAPLAPLVQRQRAVEELRREHAFAERLIDTAHAVVLVLDREGRIVRFNRFLEELSGWGLEEVRGADWFGTFLPERTREPTRAIFREVLAERFYGPNVDPLLTRSGEERAIEWYGSALRDEEGAAEGILAVGQDVTERRAAERDLRASQERARRAERLASIGTLASGIAHEINNPVGAILLAASAAREAPETPEGRGELARALDDILEDARRCRAIVKEVLRFARGASDAREPADANALALRVCEHLAARAREARSALETDLAAKLPAVPMSTREMEQVLENLVENALSVGARRVVLRTRAEERALRLAVADDGPGIEPSARERLFDPFFTTRRARGGTGLGLSIVHRIVTDHGGRVAVESEPGRGATFTVELPYAAREGEGARHGERPGGG